MFNNFQTSKSESKDKEEEMEEKQDQPITADDKIIDIIKTHPSTMKVMFQAGMACMTCPAALMESVDQAARVHGLDPELLVKLLNKQVAKDKEEAEKKDEKSDDE